MCRLLTTVTASLNLFSKIKLLNKTHNQIRVVVKDLTLKNLLTPKVTFLIKLVPKTSDKIW